MSIINKIRFLLRKQKVLRMKMMIQVENVHIQKVNQNNKQDIQIVQNSQIKKQKKHYKNYKFIKKNQNNYYIKENKIKDLNLIQFNLLKVQQMHNKKLIFLRDYVKLEKIYLLKKKLIKYHKFLIMKLKKNKAFHLIISIQLQLLQLQHQGLLLKKSCYDLFLMIYFKYIYATILL
ncbi:unnamed protein product [Paramecium primaurelia]|uniref:Uncharacterized protein n=1 Tax=Paramecium primaurelia TaxID=5886 RepID=A0A8S1LLK3_PARPR|nr:unnamed protein product [Paramecium primaurelia]